MTARDLHEDSGFAAEFEYWRHAGADPELIAMVGPLLRGELEGGSAAAARAAATYLNRQSKFGMVRDLSSMTDARQEAAALLREHGQLPDCDLIRRYASGEEQTEQLLDGKYGHASGGAVETDRQLQTARSTPASMQCGYQPINMANEQREREPRYAESGPRPYWEYE